MLESARQSVQSLRKQVVDRLCVLVVQLLKEQTDLVAYPRVGVLQQKAQVNQLTLQFYHIVHDEMHQYQQCLFPYMHFLILQQSEQLSHPLVEQIREPLVQIPDGNDDIAFDY